MNEVGLTGVDAISVAAIILKSGLLDDKSQHCAQHDSLLTGQIYLEELRDTGNLARFRNVTRMDKSTFEALLLLLETQGEFKNSKYLSTGEKLLMFILVLVGNSNRGICERWQHSGSTTSLVVHEVAAVMLRCHHHFLFPAKVDDPVAPQILSSYKYTPYFNDCIGALDGTHIPAFVPVAEQRPFRNRKKVLTLNVLGVANFDQTFSYVLTGWEGGAHDSRVLNDAKTKGFPLFPNKYYLGDAGYGLSKHVLTPYRGVRYHLKEWGNANQRPQNAKELFNYRHSSLRNVVERIFGVVKKRFPVLVVMKSYSFSFQCDLVMCSLMLHNFIRSNQLYDDEFNAPIPPGERDVEDDLDDLDDVDEAHGNCNQLKQWRDGIANEMWNDYLVYANNNDLESDEDEV